MSKALQDLRSRIPNRSADNNKYLMLAQMLALGWTFEEVWTLMHLSVKTHKAEKMYPAVVAAAEASIRNEIPWFNPLVESLQKELPKVYAEDIDSQQAQQQTAQAKPKKVIVDDDDDDIDFTSKESILKSLRQQARITSDPKLKAEILMKIADLQQMKKDSADSEKRHVMHFLPARCNACPCFKVAKEQYPDIKTLDR